MQVVENDRLRNGNREALTALRKKARTTKASVPSPFESIMKEIGGHGSKTLVQEICPTCGNHDATENMWMMFPGTDVFAQVPFHAAHTILEEDQERLDSELKELQSLVKEKSLIISDKGAIADKISPGILSVHIGLDLYTSGSSKLLMVFGSDI
uniref:P53 and DNA damage-regulated protein 1 n=1 Tax=Chenopodium quinoa TaxID=63459 RepID=A0A803MU53_CHEQI